MFNFNHSLLAPFIEKLLLRNLSNPLLIKRTVSDIIMYSFGYSYVFNGLVLFCSLPTLKSTWRGNSVETLARS